MWEPALAVTHADGNTSTDLKFASAEQTNVAPGIDVTRVHLRDPQYPLDVDLCFRTHQSEDLIEQWVEIRHQEDKPIVLSRMASSALLFSPTNLYLTHFYGDWADEMQPEMQKLLPGMKTVDSKLGVRADQFCSPSFILSLDGPPAESSGRVLAGSLAWSGSFQCAFDHNGRHVRALTGVNPFQSAYLLEAGKTFVTPTMIWVWSGHGPRRHGPEISQLGAALRPARWK